MKKLKIVSDISNSSIPKLKEVQPFNVKVDRDKQS